jgi:hypothetical protein
MGSRSGSTMKQLLSEWLIWWIDILYAAEMAANSAIFFWQ